MRDFLSVLFLALAIAGCVEFFMSVPLPADPPHMSVKTICSSPDRPEWCQEFYSDLARAGKEVRDPLQCNAGSNCIEDEVLVF